MDFIKKRNLSISLRNSLSEQSASSPTALQNDVFTLSLSSSEASEVHMKTKQAKSLINLNLDDFTRIHSLFSDKNTKQMFIATKHFSFAENEKIKFQLHLYPSQHSMSFNAFYTGSEPSAQLFIDAYLLDKDQKRFPFEFSRKVECYINSGNMESVTNFLYDRNDLEKKRDKLFNQDRLTICFDVLATWVDSGDSGHD